YLVGGRAYPERLKLTADTKEIELTLRLPGELKHFTNVRGRLLRPDGSPAAGVTVNAKAPDSGVSMASYSRNLPPVTAADGTFQTTVMGGDGPVNLYAEADRRRSLLARTVSIGPATTQPQDLGELRMIASQTATVHATNIAGKPVPNL